MFEGLELAAMVLAPVFLGAVIFYIVLRICAYFTNPLRVFRRSPPRVFRK
jgi:hypothetical protein